MLTTRDDSEVLLSGVVRWSKKAPARYAHKLTSGMGIQVSDFESGRDIFESFCPREVCIDCGLADDAGTVPPE